MQTNLYSFSILSLNMQDEERLRQSILACAQVLGLEFVADNAMQAKALFLSKDSAFTHIMLNKAKKDKTIFLFFVVSESNQEEPSDLSTQGWPCIKANIAPDCLSSILKKHLNLVDASQAQQEAELSQYSFATLTELTENLYRLITQRKQYISITNGEQTIFLNLDKNIFFLDSTQDYDFDQSNISIKKLYSLFKQGGLINVLTEDTCDFLSHNYQTYMAHRFLWLLGEQTTEELINGINIKNNTFGITHWPDFGSLKADPSYLRICASLIQTPLTLHEIKNKLNLSKAQVIAFLNSSMLCQHLIYGSNLHATPKNTVATLSREEIINCRQSLTIENGQ